MINVVYFQYATSILIVFFVMFLFFLYKRNKKGAIISFSLLLVSMVAQLFIYFNFTGTNERIKKEIINSSKLFEKRIEIKKKKLSEFNYTKSFKKEEKEIQNEVNKIHNSIK